MNPIAAVVFDIGGVVQESPLRVAFLDDIGRNRKPARALGMVTIQVDDPDQALRELGVLLGLDLRS